MGLVELCLKIVFVIFFFFEEVEIRKSVFLLSLLLGFVFPLMWYYATILYFGNYYLKDPRERAGLAASAIASVSLVLLKELPRTKGETRIHAVVHLQQKERSKKVLYLRIIEGSVTCIVAPVSDEHNTESILQLCNIHVVEELVLFGHFCWARIHVKDYQVNVIEDDD
ncbi:hypothetical protein GOBAR_AA26549 [Gossypium barbadense]|uniref:Uncharacterized protein n=1 Tax=Gossypium barbadense TaxID=3634 RepID=A0A2P5WSR3_GOSBA|nr:hypothetical protein GOBAR_AA26549 [Gossypium barbadense]